VVVCLSCGQDSKRRNIMQVKNLKTGKTSRLATAPRWKRAEPSDGSCEFNSHSFRWLQHEML
jgi:hypothetical protein